ncbi:MAG: hypothetical protein CL908_10985 [Deltaproteobacteria bacterium]|nr:hypothetical protein [Deltaproteobacteria bacterium]
MSQSKDRSEVRWLHLSDLHRGAPGGEARWKNAKSALLEDMSARAKDYGSPDLILFTGDLAFKGIEAEYALVDRTLKEVKEAVGGDPVVVPVPGNHDLARPRPKSIIVKALQSYHADYDVRQSFIGAERDYIEPLERAFGAYHSWWEQIKRDWADQKLDFESECLPGRLA